MAKVTGPLFSMDARNKFGGALVFTAWKGRNVVRQLVTPANPMTQNQEDARNRVRGTGKAQKQVNTSIEIQDTFDFTDKQLLTAKAPAGQAWNGFLTNVMIGKNDITDEAAAAAWTTLTSGQKTAWDVAAAARVPAFQAAPQNNSGGTATTPMTAGQVYFHQQYGMYAAGIFPSAPTATPPTYA